MSKKFIPEYTVAQLRSYLPQVLEHYGARKVQHGATRRYQVCCPFHDDKHPSMDIHPHKQVYKCHACGKGGDVFTAVEHGGDVSRTATFAERAAAVAAIVGIPLSTSDTITPHTPLPPKPPRPALPPKKVTYIDAAHVTATERALHHASLYVFLSRIFGADATTDACSRYHVGARVTYPNPMGGCAITFPFLDLNGRCVDIKLAAYNPATGGRSKQENNDTPFYIRKNGEPSYITWALSKMNLNHERATLPLFGEHLLPLMPDAAVGIVESEKSALICAMTCPSLVWLATGGKGRLKAEALAVCRSRKIVLYPDRDGHEAWTAAADELRANGFVVIVDDTVQRYPGKPKDDIADLILRAKMGTQEQATAVVADAPKPAPMAEQAAAVTADMVTRHPGLSNILQNLSLTPTYVYAHAR